MNAPTAPQFPSTAAFYAHNRAEIRRRSLVPVAARWDGAGNCVICGEAGRCPGWHTPAEAQRVELLALAGASWGDA